MERLSVPQVLVLLLFLYIPSPPIVRTEKVLLSCRDISSVHSRHNSGTNKSDSFFSKDEFAYGCCGAFLSGCLLALLIAYRRKKHVELRDKFHALESRFTQLLNVLERSSSENFYLRNAFERQLQRFQNLLDRAFKATNQKNFVREFKAFAASIREDKSLFADLRYIVNVQSNGLTERLQAAHPNLTEYELDLLCMLRLGFSFDCIRLLHRHENIYSLYTRRTKIHRKMGLPPRLRLEEYLEELAGKSEAGNITPDQIANF